MSRTTQETPEGVGFKKEHAAAKAGETKGGRTIAPTIRDPGIQHGSFRALQRTDGPWITYDERLPLGKRTVAVFTAKQHEDPRAAAEADAAARDSAEKKTEPTP